MLCMVHTLLMHVATILLLMHVRDVNIGIDATATAMCSMHIQAALIDDGGVVLCGAQLPDCDDILQQSSPFIIHHPLPSTVLLAIQF